MKKFLKILLLLFSSFLFLIVGLNIKECGNSRTKNIKKSYLQSLSYGYTLGTTYQEDFSIEEDRNGMISLYFDFDSYTYGSCETILIKEGLSNPYISVGYFNEQDSFFNPIKDERYDMYEEYSAVYYPYSVSMELYHKIYGFSILDSNYDVMDLDSIDINIIYGYYDEEGGITYDLIDYYSLFNENGINYNGSEFYGEIYHSFDYGRIYNDSGVNDSGVARIIYIFTNGNDNSLSYYLNLKNIDSTLFYEEIENDQLYERAVPLGISSEMTMTAWDFRYDGEVINWLSTWSASENEVILQEQIDSLINNLNEKTLENQNLQNELTNLQNEYNYIKENFDSAFEEGRKDALSIINFVKSILLMLDELLSIEILPYIKLYYIVGIPVILSIVDFILKRFR